MVLSSNFARHITDMVEQKHALGYKYTSQADMLRRFDVFCVERFPTDTALTREVMHAWMMQRPGEHPATLQGRVGPARELAKYMVRLGIEAYLPPKGTLPKIPQYIPHIYSNEELKRIFERTDSCHPQNEVPFRHLVMPVFFRLLYCTGMRLTEARMLKVGDVDIDEGVIVATKTKLDKHRQLPVSSAMLSRLAEYHKNVHALSKPDDWFFPGYKCRPMTIGNVEKNLRKFLWQSGISHGGRGSGPRIHDFRHTFAVHCLRRWVLEGKDLRAYLPILQTYLGHVSLNDTAYYLHLTADLFPDITEKVNAMFGYIIPKAGDPNEAD